MTNSMAKEWHMIFESALGRNLEGLLDRAKDHVPSEEEKALAAKEAWEHVARIWPHEAEVAQWKRKQEEK